jgi:hypothetical protein
MTAIEEQQEERGMTAVEKYFFTPLYYPRSAWSVVRWWEARRPMFNAVIGSAGLLSVGVATLLSNLPPHPSGMVAFPLGGVVVYGVLANLCYTLGAPADLALRRLLGERAPAIGPALFRYGFVFSLGLTLLPIPLSLLGWVLRWLLH